MTRVPDAFGFFDPKQEYSVRYGSLPHWEQPGATYFITYRTADSIPQAASDLWRRERADALLRLGIDVDRTDWLTAFGSLGWEKKLQFHRQFATKLEHEVDQLHGDCPLANPKASKIVEENLLRFDGDRYHLGGFVVMPNHVHVLVCLAQEIRVKDQCKNWKHYQSREINRLLGLEDRPWQSESFDHLVRDGDHFHKFRKYIEENPTNANLKDSEFRLYLPDLKDTRFVAD